MYRLYYAGLPKTCFRLRFQLGRAVVDNLTVEVHRPWTVQSTHWLCLPSFLTAHSFVTCGDWEAWPKLGSSRPRFQTRFSAFWKRNRRPKIGLPGLTFNMAFLPTDRPGGPLPYVRRGCCVNQRGFQLRDLLRRRSWGSGQSHRIGIETLQRPHTTNTDPNMST